MLTEKTKIKECGLRWGISLGAVGILFCIIGFLSPITWETNDDQVIMGYLAGFMTGTPEVLPCVINFLYAKLISGLYALNSNVPWYTCVFIFLLFLSSATICNCFLKCFKKKKYWIIGLGIFGIIFCAIYIEIFVNIQFTTVAAMCGVACISLLATHRKEEIWLENIIDSLIAAIVMLFSFNIREEVGYIAIAVLMCTLVVQIFMGETEKKFTIGYIVIISLVISCSLISDRIYEKNNDWESYVEFNRACTSYLDYLNLSFEGNEEIYKSVGWNENVWQLVGSWCLLDENVSEETFSILNKAYEREQKQSVQENVELAIRMIIDNKNVTRIIKLGFVLIIIQLIMGYRLGKCVDMNVIEKTKQWKSFVVCLAYMLGTFCLYGYFAYLPRFVPRIVKMVTIIGITPFILNFAKWIDVIMGAIVSKLDSKVICKKFVIEIMMVCFACASWSLKGAQRLYIGESFSYMVKTGIEQYAISNRDNLYIYDAAISNEFISPFQVYPDEQPYNLMFWGGWAKESPLWNKQLEKNGYEEIRLENLFDEKVFFIGEEKYANMILLRLQDISKDASYEIVDEVQGYMVYKFEE